ncbi:hypothetical protein [Larkinella humicola]|uniref:Lipoprotein n=1 Tax=Larkinella humicola TaxID=2607654 RepID=A0A5N1JGG1_9BACT|nr:hypothetical protein [Larkinella humicola]KAA9353899.1 hypothetical protein F0P93_14860 [Larkinella humicola]
MNRIFSPFLFLICPAFFLFFASACNPERNQNTKALVQEMNDNKIKRVTNVQLTTTVDEWGKALVLTTRKVLIRELTKKPGDSTFCNLKNVPAIRRLEKQYAITIDLLKAKDVTNPALNPKERDLLGAYVYNAQNKLEQNDNVQKLNDTLFVYNSPVATDDIICKTCTDNAALPFVIWRIVFNKREVIRRINPKKLK